MCRAGAGNQLPVVALDILHMLFAEDQVVLVKMNPVNDYYGPLLRQVTGAQQVVLHLAGTNPSQQERCPLIGHRLSYALQGLGGGSGFRWHIC